MLWKLTAVAFAATLVACGSGSDVVEADTTTIEGAIVKGPVHNAKVAAYKVNADGSRGDKLGDDVRSEADGSYKLSFSGYSDAVVIVEAAADAETVIKDEATSSNVNPGVSFKLRSAVSLPPTGRTFKVQVNPLTDVAVAAAQRKTGGLSAVNVEQANAELRSSVTGFDPLEDKPTFDANGTATNKAGLMMAAVSQMAKQGDLGCTTGDAAAKINCVVQKMAVDGLGSAAVIAALENRIAMVAEKVDSSIVPTIRPPSTVPLNETTALAQAKAFMGTLRSNAKALDAADVSLQTELQAVSDDMTGRVAPMASSSISAFELATKAAQFWSDFQASANPQFSRGFYNYSGNYPEYIGGCSMYADTDYLELATTKANAKYVACGTPSQTERYVNGAPVYWRTMVRLHPQANDQFDVYTRTRRSVMVWDATKGWTDPVTNPGRTNYGANHPGNKATLKAQRDSAGKIVAVQFAGEMSPSYQFNHSGYPQYLTTVSVLGDKLKVDLGGSWIVDAAGINTVALRGSVAQYKTVNAVDQLQTSLALEDGSYFKAKATSVVEGNGQPVVGGDGSHEMLLKLRYATANSAVAGQLSIGNFSLDASKTVYSPTKVSFAGSMERNGAKFFDGSLTAEGLNFSAFKANQPRSTTNIQSTKGTIQGMVAIKDRPTLKVNLVLSGQDKGSVVSNALSGQYSQGASVINITGQGGTGQSGSVTLQSSTGIRLVYDGTKTSHPLTKSGYAVGTFNSVTNRVTYTDGSFEQF